jgi:cytochrome c oxidase assembly protein subunit 15
MSKPTHSSKAVFFWLLSCCVMIFVMALIGAITRLTQSGLSITDWNPIMGALPPLNDATWQNAFAAYKKIPQYQIFNRGMSLDAFKDIYYWEWIHRLWGRLIALVFAVPLIVFAVHREINRTLAGKLVTILILIGFQGFIGWYMVESGLEIRTSVSPYRLALHLVFALAIYSLTLWTALGTQNQTSAEKHSPSSENLIQGWLTLGLLVITITWGAFVAGLHAGEAYNTWPLMDGEFLPSSAITLQPHWINVFENLAFVQFIHRWLGPLTMLAILAWVIRNLKSTDDKRTLRWFKALAGMSFVQVALGMATLMTHVNIVIATLHQGGAITLLSLMLINLHRIKRLA